MNEFEKLCKHIDNELHKIEEKGLNQGNLETAYKLVDMYKDMAKAEYYKMMVGGGMEEMGGFAGEYSGGYSGGNGGGGGYSNGMSGRRGGGRGGYSGAYSGAGMGGMAGGRGEYDMESSYARRGGRQRRDSMGRYAGNYSGAYEGYQQAKDEYRMSKSGECKSNVLEMLGQYMEEIKEELSEMSRNADCQEERQEIMKYLDKMRNMIN